MFKLHEHLFDWNLSPIDLFNILKREINLDIKYNENDECLIKTEVEGKILFGEYECLSEFIYIGKEQKITTIKISPNVPKELFPKFTGVYYGEEYAKYNYTRKIIECDYAKNIVSSIYNDNYIKKDESCYIWNFDKFNIIVEPRKENNSTIYSNTIIINFK